MAYCDSTTRICYDDQGNPITEEEYMRLYGTPAPAQDQTQPDIETDNIMRNLWEGLKGVISGQTQPMQAQPDVPRETNYRGTGDGTHRGAGTYGSYGTPVSIDPTTGQIAWNIPATATEHTGWTFNVNDRGYQLALQGVPRQEAQDILKREFYGNNNELMRQMEAYTSAVFARERGDRYLGGRQLPGTIGEVPGFNAALQRQPTAQGLQSGMQPQQPGQQPGQMNIPPPGRYTGKVVGFNPREYDAVQYYNADPEVIRQGLQIPEYWSPTANAYMNKPTEGAGAGTTGAPAETVAYPFGGLINMPTVEGDDRYRPSQFEYNLMVDEVYNQLATQGYPVNNADNRAMTRNAATSMVLEALGFNSPEEIFAGVPGGGEELGPWSVEDALQLYGFLNQLPSGVLSPGLTSVLPPEYAEEIPLLAGLTQEEIDAALPIWQYFAGGEQVPTGGIDLEQLGELATAAQRAEELNLSDEERQAYFDALGLRDIQQGIVGMDEDVLNALLRTVPAGEEGERRYVGGTGEDGYGYFDETTGEFHWILPPETPGIQPPEEGLGTFMGPSEGQAQGMQSGYGTSTTDRPWAQWYNENIITVPLAGYGGVQIDDSTSWGVGSTSVHRYLAQVLGSMTPILADQNITMLRGFDSQTGNPTNPRYIEGTNTLSSHQYGLGVDIYGFVKNGEDYWVSEFYDETKGPVVQEFVSLLGLIAPAGSTILGPADNQAHSNHIHFNVPYDQRTGQPLIPQAEGMDWEAQFDALNINELAAVVGLQTNENYIVNGVVDRDKLNAAVTDLNRAQPGWREPALRRFRELLSSVQASPTMGVQTGPTANIPAPVIAPEAQQAYAGQYPESPLLGAVGWPGQEGIIAETTASGIPPAEWTYEQLNDALTIWENEINDIGWWDFVTGEAYKIMGRINDQIDAIQIGDEQKQSMKDYLYEIFNSL